MTAPLRKEAGSEAGPGRREPSRCDPNALGFADNDNLEEKATDGPGDRLAPSRKRRSVDQAKPERVKRVCTQQEGSVADLTDCVVAETGRNVTTFRTSEESPSTPTAGAGELRFHPQPNGVDDPELKVNSRAVYNTNKDEIDTWYDKQYSRKLGLPKDGKIMHSDNPWYQKLAAWQKHKGHVQLPKRRRRRNHNRAQHIDTQTLRPHPLQTRRPGDLVAVPEYPFENLEDFGTMPNGNYACAHINREPPLTCCQVGLTRHAKSEAIKKSKEIWKKQVERLIDAGKLSPAHKEWRDWLNLKLREKYQPTLFKEQRERKEKRVQMKRNEERVRGVKGREAVERRQHAATHSNRRTAAIRVSSRVSDLPSYKQPPPTVPESISFPQQPIGNSFLQPLSEVQHHSSSNDITRTQTSFLGNLAQTNLRSLRQYDALYHDAQYREAAKEVPNFALLRMWYLAYFLNANGQPLSAEQRRFLESEDPSYLGAKRGGGRPALGRVDLLFGEYFQDARGGSAQASSFTSAGLVPTAIQAEPFEQWDPETIEGELDRLLATRPLLQKHAGAAVSGNKDADAQMEDKLQHAYRTEDEQLLREAFEYSRADWLHYCDFAANE